MEKKDTKRRGAHNLFAVPEGEAEHQDVAAPGSGFSVQGLGFRIWGVGCSDKGLGFRV